MLEQSHTGNGMGSKQNTHEFPLFLLGFGAILCLRANLRSRKLEEQILICSFGRQDHSQRVTKFGRAVVSGRRRSERPMSGDRGRKDSSRRATKVGRTVIDFLIPMDVLHPDAFLYVFEIPCPLYPNPKIRIQ
ncbi:hypothetical protein M5K25_007961 [Dendrobium thyrsiflorum]|uniref:Uncharacterized protein n=1 Tax=Dendrobium thyrsiflorum TaxID=117978 RepID=A0ABD0V773_DENTH